MTGLAKAVSMRDESVKEDAVDVYIRHRNDLIKAIYDNVYADDEVGFYIQSLQNLENQNITFDVTKADEIAFSYTAYMLKKAKKQKNINISRLIQQESVDHPWSGQIRNDHVMTQRHGKWPETVSTYGYWPFSKHNHPLRRRNAVTGKPEWERKLSEMYFSDDDSPSFAERLMGKEDAHEAYHLKQGHSLYRGVKGGTRRASRNKLDDEGNAIHAKNTKGDLLYDNENLPIYQQEHYQESLPRKQPFIGSKSKHGQSHYKHIHSTRLADFERWKKKQGDERLAELESNGVNLEKEHFNQRMEDLMLGGNTRGKLTRKISEQEYQDHLLHNPQFEDLAAAKRDLRVNNSVKHNKAMGWETWAYGLEFVAPQDRTKILQHIHEHGTDHPEHQDIKLSDGHIMPMARLKLNKERRTNAELHHWMRMPHQFGPNTHQYLETSDDNTTSGMEGAVKKALNSVYLEPYEYTDPDTGETSMIEDSAHERLRKNIVKMFEGDVDIDDINNLFSFSNSDVAAIKRERKKGKSLKDIITSRIHKTSDVKLTEEGLQSLVGYDKKLNELDNHSIFNAYNEPLLDKEIMQQVMDNIQFQKGLVTEEKPIRRGLSVTRIGNNGPKPDDKKLTPEEKSHYFEDKDGNLKGWAHMEEDAYSHSPGIGKTHTSYLDILHNHLSTDGGKSSPLGYLQTDEEGKGQTQYSIIPNSGNTGMFGNLHNIQRDTGVVGSGSALEIMAHTDKSRPNARGRILRNNHNNSSDTESTSFPNIMTRPPNIETNFDVDSEKYDIKRNISRNGSMQKLHSDNPFTRVGSAQRGDTSLMDIGAMHHRLLADNGRYPPWDSHPGWGVTSYEELFADPDKRTSMGVSHPEYLRMLGDAGSAESEDDGHTLDSKLSTNYNQLSDFDTKNERGKTATSFNLKPFYEDLQHAEEYLDWIKNPYHHNTFKSMDKKEALSYLGKKTKLNIDDWYTLEIKRAEDRVTELNNSLYPNEMRDLTLGRSITKQPSIDFYNKRLADKQAQAEYAKTVLLPMVLEHDPSAFDPSDPIKFMHNSQRLWEDAGRGLIHDPNHNITTMGYHIVEGDRKSIEEMEGGSFHKNVASIFDMMHQSGRTMHELNPTMKVDKALKVLGLPNDDAHQNYVRDYLSSLNGPVRAASLGQIATWGQEIMPQGSEHMDTLSRGGVTDLYAHMDSTLENYRNSIPKKRDNRTLYENMSKPNAVAESIPSYRTLNQIKRRVRPSSKRSVLDKNELEHYGLSHYESKDPLHPREINKKGKPMKNANNQHASYKDIASHIITYDEQSADKGKNNQFTPFELEQKPTVDFTTAPLKPLKSQDGILLHANWPREHGHVAEPTVGFEFERDGRPVVGSNPQTSAYPSMPQAAWYHIFGEGTYDNVIGNVDITNPRILQTQPAWNQTNPITGTSYADNPQQIGKADLPKEVPLIDPLHRIFDLDDLNQLRGFTGEWVVSTLVDGTRCKVVKKNNRIIIFDEKGKKIPLDDDVKDSLKLVCKKDYVIDGILKDDEFYVNDILYYDDDEVTELTTRERIKILRGQFESYHPVFIPSPSDVRITDEVGLEAAVKDLGKESDKIMLRDAKSTYMKGEEKHPKWVILAKSEVDYHVTFATEIDNGYFIIHLPEDLVKYEIVEGKAVNPVSAIGSLTNSDYSIRLAKSLEPYWGSHLEDLLKEESQIEPEMDEERVEEESAGILKPKKDKNILLKPQKEMYKALLIMEKLLDEIEKGHSNLAGRGLGIDVGGGVESPRGPTRLTAEQSLPDWDMKNRPTEDLEKPDDYPGRKQKKKEIAAQSSVFDERNLD